MIFMWHFFLKYRIGIWNVILMIKNRFMKLNIFKCMKYNIFAFFVCVILFQYYFFWCWYNFLCQQFCMSYFILLFLCIYTHEIQILFIYIRLYYWQMRNRSQNSARNKRNIDKMSTKTHRWTRKKATSIEIYGRQKTHHHTHTHNCIGCCVFVLLKPATCCNSNDKQSFQ